MNKQTPLEPWNDPAVEARVVAWVMGEAAEFEAAEVRRLLAEHPELAAFARRIQAVHDLLGEAVAPEPTGTVWAMSKEGREKLETKLGPLDGVAGGAVAAVARKSWYRRAVFLFPTLSAAAAVMMVGVVSIYHMGGCSAGMMDEKSVAVAEQYAPPELPNHFGSDDPFSAGHAFPVTPATPVYLEEEVEEGLRPMLRDIPVIGRLFRGGQEEKEAEIAMVPLQTELPRELSVGTPKDVSRVFGEHEEQLRRAGSGEVAMRSGRGDEADERRRPEITVASGDDRRVEVVREADPFAAGGGGGGGELGYDFSVDPFAAGPEVAEGRDNAERQEIAVVGQVQSRALAPRPQAGAAAGAPTDGGSVDAFAAPPAPAPARPAAPAQPSSSARSVVEVAAGGPQWTGGHQAWVGDESEKARFQTERDEKATPGGGAVALRELASGKVELNAEVAAVGFDGFVDFGASVVEGGDGVDMPVFGKTSFEGFGGMADVAEGGLRKDISKLEDGEVLKEGQGQGQAAITNGLRSGDAAVTRGEIDALLNDLDQTWELAETPPPPPPAEEPKAETEGEGEGEDKQKGKENRAKPSAPAESAARQVLEAEDAAVNPVSTFSLFVSDASFRQAAAALLRENRLPEPSAVRTEDFVNAFHYGDPSPGAAEAVACAVDQSAHPFLPGRNLVRLGVTTASSGRGDGQPLRLTIALDSSGSMDRPDRAKVVGVAMEKLAGALRDGDTVSLVTFARQPRLHGDRLQGEAARAGLRGLAQAAPPEGGTNLETALDLIEQLALRGAQPDAMNRVVLITDGAANLGTTDPEALGDRIAALRARGIFFDVCGVGTTGLDDQVLEALSRRGDGRYLVLDAEDRDAGARFARELAGAFRPAARNVKVQVRFNPERVGRFQLLGFEKHILREEDFKDDTVSAASLAAAEQGNAMYQVELLPQGRGEIGEVAVRFLDTASNQMVERRWTIPYDAATPALDLADAPTRLAVAAALFAEALRGTPVGRTVEVARLRELASPLRLSHRDDPNVVTLLQMIGKTEELMK